MRALVIGGGSIGKRHLQNLKLLGVNDLALVEPSEERRKTLTSSGLAVGFSDLSEAFSWNPTFAVVATPPFLHAAQALELASRGIHLFIEKPLSHSPAGLRELRMEVAARKLITLVGCNMRFHPGPLKVKALLEQNVLGPLLFARLHAGSYMANWRPGTDYRKGYGANASMGGGCLLDGIHEIDLAYWYLGTISDVFCRAEKLSSLEIDVEDVAILVCRHSRGIFSEIHLDYVQRSYERGCQITGEQGSLFWDFRETKVRWYDCATNAWQVFEAPKGWEANQMYLDEMAHYLDCLRQNRPTLCPVAEAERVTRIVFAAKQSSRSDRMERVETPESIL
jgi:predicted dehydrogenase